MPSNETATKATKRKKLKNKGFLRVFEVASPVWGTGRDIAPVNFDRLPFFRIDSCKLVRKLLRLEAVNVDE